MLCTYKAAAAMPNVLEFIIITKTVYFQKMWELHRKLNFLNFFRLAAIYTWAPAFSLHLHANLNKLKLKKNINKKNTELILCMLYSFDTFDLIWGKSSMSSNANGFTKTRDKTLFDFGIKWKKLTPNHRYLIQLDIPRNLSILFKF